MFGLCIFLWNFIYSGLHLSASNFDKNYDLESQGKKELKCICNIHNCIDLIFVLFKAIGTVLIDLPRLLCSAIGEKRLLKIKPH